MDLGGGGGGEYTLCNIRRRTGEGNEKMKTNTKKAGEKERRRRLADGTRVSSIVIAVQGKNLLFSPYPINLFL